MKTSLFCAVCNESTYHKIGRSKFGEVDFICGVCGHLVRAPDGSAADIQACIAEHNRVNVPREKADAPISPDALFVELAAEGTIS